MNRPSNGETAPASPNSGTPRNDAVRSAPWREEERPLSAVAAEASVLLRIPERSAPRQALLVYLAMDRRTSLDVHPYSTVPNAFLAAGHRVASFDLPNHGALVNAYGESLVGMAAAMKDGVDVFGMVGALGRAAVDACTADMRGPAPPVVAAGTSRGGLSALHVMASDRRVRAAAAFAPVTDLAVLCEFAPLAASPLLQRSNARALVERLAGRLVYVSINSDDPRVGTDRCVAFCDALRAAGPAEVALTVTPAQGHSVADECYREGAAFLLRHCR